MAYPIPKTSILNIISRINSASSAGGDIILPAIQRDFVWKTKDITKLFDSLMNDYPINTMLFWKNNNIAGSAIKFYKFLDPNFKIGDKNQVIQHPNANQPYFVVIDGQQRLTSLYIALMGSYSKNSSAKNLAQELYLRLDQGGTAESPMKFDFQFLTRNAYNTKSKKNEIWYRVKEAVKNAVNKKDVSVNIYFWMQKHNIGVGQYAHETLLKLIDVLTDINTINYYEITTGKNNIDDVLDIFIRTNSGGYVLTKGALMLSTLASDWATTHGENARDYVEDVIKDVELKGYKIDKDWVLRCCGILVGASASIKVSSFATGNTCEEIYKRREDIQRSINKAFEILKFFHLLEKGLSTKLAVIPIVYFIFKNNLWSSAIINTNQYAQIWSDMRKFLFRAIVQNLFEAATDTILDNIKSIIDNNTTVQFPYAEIEKKYPELGNLNFDDILNTKKREAFPTLNIIYALAGKPLIPSSPYDIDHIHPKDNFSSNNIKNITFATPSDETIAKDGATFDTICNLQLLNASINRSKNAKDLKSWYNQMQPQHQTDWRTCNIIDLNAPLDMADFGTFINIRKLGMKTILSNL